MNFDAWVLAREAIRREARLFLEKTSAHFQYLPEMITELKEACDRVDGLPDGDPTEIVAVNKIIAGVGFLVLDTRWPPRELKPLLRAVIALMRLYEPSDANQGIIDEYEALLQECDLAPQE